MKDEKKAPKLRFKGFTDDWEQRKLGDVAKITAGGDINKGDLINKGKYPVIANGLNNNGIVGYSNKYKIDAPAVTITGRGTLGVATARFINFTPIVRLISIKSDLDPIYLENVINNTHFVIESTGVPQLTAPQVKRQTVILSNCHIEQTKIGSLFLTLDNAITLHEEKKHQLERLKSALLQKMFADKSGYPDIRFEGFSDEWEQCKLGDLADRVTTKNKGMVSELPLTISAQDGLISQDEFFNKKVASKDLSSYLLLHHGDFAYNKSYSNGYPFGTIKRLEKYPQGVVSSLYIAFKPNSSISSDFMAQYYESNNWHKEIYKCAAEGARNHGLLNVPPSDFFATNLNIPITKSEQLKIGRLLNAVDQTITLHDQKLNLLKLVKQSLLQNMFI
ncbi:restriction endonuclease subunit S [Lactobacillus delbrueckii subsp. bulgaricus]|uniref:restriction endonuclease subunit S n=1 Tax=Lactobacillus delbrueckii TaxID=1584 RepID=UPI001E647B65|nr:restriction endonuclease subunit S [Lactobacillus delbrueckii]MCD5462359.1 restriction endonuclease subunit S [Lactobacillus delbrueckii subsp. bulgaricus]MCD5477980.1 restriction endonuclease subunit S [Lactobacillus delbrueckii subsp. bulgaricus]MCT3478896.1 restriction endonuclease subunit S [Lactobacillus delbrueckii subsp. bulgaricus]MCT3479546.1 restriction endonuclease subunit S [Lactobacillus delbrueckii subsp. bulgaricus]